jgi:hypothetical protein
MSREGFSWVCLWKDISELAARMNESAIQFEIRFFTLCCLDRCPKFGLIIRMDALKKRFVSRLFTVPIKTQYPVTFFGQISDFADSRGPTARLTEPLRFRQITLAPSKLILCVLALKTFYMESLVGCLEVSNRSSQVITRPPERLRGAPLGCA